MSKNNLKGSYPPGLPPYELNHNETFKYIAMISYYV